MAPTERTQASERSIARDGDEECESRGLSNCASDSVPGFSSVGGVVHTEVVARRGASMLRIRAPSPYDVVAILLALSCLVGEAFAR
jgi:hypothetical protein